MPESDRSLKLHNTFSGKVTVGDWLYVEQAQEYVLVTNIEQEGDGNGAAWFTFHLGSMWRTARKSGDAVTILREKGGTVLSENLPQARVGRGADVKPGNVVIYDGELCYVKQNVRENEVQVLYVDGESVGAISVYDWQVVAYYEKWPTI